LLEKADGGQDSPSEVNSCAVFCCCRSSRAL